jgi:hypothetical protein
MRPAIFASFFIVLIRPLLAGDAIAIGYNYDGAWSAVTYNRSSTPKGSLHYHGSAQACAFAVRDLWVRASDNLARTEIVGRSDRTGYVSVAQGKSITRNKDVTAVGRGKSQNEADRNAMKKLSDRDAMAEAAIVYQYFSYGDDSGTRSRSKHKAGRASKRLAKSQSTANKT